MSDDLIGRAKARAEGGGVDESWGALVDLDEEESFVGRWRGQMTDPDNGRPVYLFWDEDGGPCWSRFYTALGRELEQAGPKLGDRVVVYRGRNYKTAHDGDEGPKGRSFGVAVEPSDEPLPVDEPEPPDEAPPF